MSTTFEVRVPSLVFPGRSELATVTVEQHGQKLRLTTPFSLKEEVKAMVGASWNKERKAWDVKDCRRNRMQLEILQGVTPPEHAPFLAPTQRFTPRRSNLLQHQGPLLDTVLTCRRKVVAADVGTGKSLLAIEAVEATCLHGREDQVWYVGPKNVIKTFQLQMSIWKGQFHPRYLTYESVRGIVAAWPAGRLSPRAIIFDECSRLKNPDAQLTEACQHLADANRAEHGSEGLVVQLSGTVAPQDHTDWWSPTEIACPGWLRESSRTKLEQRLGIFERKEGQGRVYHERTGWQKKEVELLPRRLAGVVRVLRQEDTQMMLPPARHEIIRLDVSEATARAAWMVVALAAQPGRVKDKLRQLSDGFQYGDEDEKGLREPTRQLEHAPKADVLRRLLLEYEDAGRFVVYGSYTASVDRCVEVGLEEGWTVLRVDGRGISLHGPSRGYTEASALDAMSRGGDHQDKLLYVGHPTAGAMGANLQGSPALLWYSLTYRAEDRIQGNGRIRRKGMDELRGCTVYDLVHLGLDELIIQRVQARQDALDITLAEIRRVTKEV